ncbi:hypothetical protein J2755_000274 [Methanohalophilus levihalophilus]|uniref:hypothetical protein n=1 Tax=Methanohalophilus levihalophilus TaxID=1431282 RepID=UPI001AEAE81C|nr:hypothetical protein [Methanohalophilus levihalophilus]MBP2029354.1 hypothetical protein [Methanohalophilus levihalophilus]
MSEMGDFLADYTGQIVAINIKNDIPVEEITNYQIVRVLDNGLICRYSSPYSGKLSKSYTLIPFSSIVSIQDLPIPEAAPIIPGIEEARREIDNHLGNHTLAQKIEGGDQQ